MQPPILVFCHLRWDFVYQRPQHLLSRLGAQRRVIVVEEPRLVADGAPRWELREPAPGVLVAQPCFRGAGPEAFADEHMEWLGHMIDELAGVHDLGGCVAWFYTPMAMPLLQRLQPSVVVYDCMDELSAFLHAPPQLIERERQLLQRADIVFTGGPSLYNAKRDLHPNVHCFPSSVDATHFARALSPGEEPADQAAVPRPRLGFFGVIDERMDIELIGALAAARPDWQIVMVGPVVKIDPATLPRNANLHYVGQKPYAQLPDYLRGWDVCLLPFARNASTRFISPTKTLEYMAAERPIVSTPIADVAEPYGHIVHLGSTPEEFTAACEQALNAPAGERRRRTEAMRQVLSRTSWDTTAKAMSDQIDRLVRSSRRRTPRRQPRQIDESWPVVVIGAGPTGLSAAYHLGPDGLVLEKHECIGGWCRSVHERGFTFDMAGHIMFSNDSYVHEMYQKLLGENVHWQDREAWIFSKGVYTRYPFQGCLYGLPPDVITECIVGAIEARFGALKRRAEMEDAVARAAQTNHGGRSETGNGNGHGTPPRGRSNRSASQSRRRSSIPSDRCKISDISDCCGDGLMEATVDLATPTADSEEPQNFEEFIYKVWGRGIARHFAIPYNRKLWAVPLTEMETSWLGGRVPMPDIEEMIRYALTPAAKPMGPNARFGYPLHGGFQALMNGFLPHVQDRLRLDCTVEQVSPSSRTVTTGDGRTLQYETLISTMPLPALIRCMGDEPPRRVREAVSKLRYVSVRCVHIGVGRENITDKHWIYYPEDTVFHRIFVQGNASPHCNPAGGFGYTCEITYAPSKPLPCDGESLIQRCIEDSIRVGFIAKEDPIWAAMQVDLPHAYVVYDHGRAANVKIIRDWLATQGILLAGRYSEWEYYNSDHAFIAGRNAAQQARQRLGQSAGAPA
jgi:UDP-galactopyranose mutase